MAKFKHPSTAVLVDAGHVRITELVKRLLYLRANHQPTTQVVQSIIDLRQKLEAMALTTSEKELNILKQYVQNVYGLTAVYTDPMLRPQLPVLAATGNVLEPLLLSINGFDVEINGFLVEMGAILVPDEAPIYNTPLDPGQMVGSVAYNGLEGTQLAFNGPVPTTGTPLYLKLYVGTVQVGRVDFLSSSDGLGFSVLYQGTLYYATFQAMPNNELFL